MVIPTSASKPRPAASIILRISILRAGPAAKRHRQGLASARATLVLVFAEWQHCRRHATTSAPNPGRNNMRTGAEYLRSLNDGRRVFVDGERVKDVTTHPAFREAARSVANLFDIAADPAQRERMTFVSPKTGAPVWRAWQIPRTHADLRARRLFSETWAEATFGLMGRSPDHVDGFFTGYAAVPELFATAGQKFADNLVAFYEFMRDNHI